MTKAELSQLMILIYASERRADAPSRAVVEAWHPQLVEFSFEDACQVVSEHYAESDRPITLAQLCGGVRKRQAARCGTDGVEERMRVPDADPDDPKAFIEALRGHRYFARRYLEDFTPRELELPRMGEVPEGDDHAEEVKPRRWWLGRGKGQERSDPGK